jgi:hypothetical protein
MTITIQVRDISKDVVDVEFYDSSLVTNELVQINTSSLFLRYTCCIRFSKDASPVFYYNILTRKNTLQANLTLQSYQKTNSPLFLQDAINELQKQGRDVLYSY